MVNLAEAQAGIDRRLEAFLRSRRPPAQGLPSEVSEMLACVHRDLFEAGFNAGLAKKRCGIRANSFSSRFRWKIGVGPREYIEALRMEAADHLLRTTDVAVFDLAMCLGYEHESTFYRAFQRRFGCSPTTHRARRQEAMQGLVSRFDRRAQV